MKKLVSFILAMTMTVFNASVMPVNCADGTGTIEVSSADAMPGEEVALEVVISENPGITALSFDITYDSDKLSLVKAEDGKILGTSTALFGNDTAANPYRLCWDDLSTENNTGTGTVATLKFTVKDDAKGTADVGITLNQSSTFNVDMEDVPFEVTGGKITIGSDIQEPVQEPTEPPTDEPEPEPSEEPSDDENAALTVKGTSCKAGGTVDVDVVLSGNPGITALSFDITYDSDKLILVKATDGKILGTSTALFGNDTTANPYRLCWDDLSTENNTGNGTVAVITFKVKEDAEGDAGVGVKLNQSSTFNVDMEDVPFETRGGKISIEPAEIGEDDALISVESTSSPSGGTVDVKIIISNNPGITALSFDVSYDSGKLTLVKATDGKILGTSTALFGNDTTANPYRLCWDDLSTENNTGNGTVAVITFKVKEDAEGEAAVNVKLNKSSTFNVDMEDVPFAVKGGKVVIGDAPVTTTTGVTTAPVTTTTMASPVTTTTKEETTTTKEVITTTKIAPATTASALTTAGDLRTTTRTAATVTKPSPEATTAPVTTTTPGNTKPADDVKLGDVNGNGNVDASDASRVLVEYAILSTGGTSTLTEEQAAAADVNGDGQINASDASTILVFYSYLSTGGTITDMREWKAASAK